MYEYTELREKALSAEATTEDRLALYNWMEQYAMSEWNGECFNIDDGLSLYPVYNITYDDNDEIDEIELIEAEIRS